MVESSIEGMTDLVNTVFEVSRAIKNCPSIYYTKHSKYEWHNYVTESDTSRYGENYDGLIIASHEFIG